ncbi:MAG: Eco57I restriction-modification methylase domain-containing protein, partial [Gammaproteobacteria bacterium]|nr:Eco57I restriction-modification methylase domain-containing protein [Gammaproteobacteria bacterium]
SVLPVEVLGNAYEQFLGKRITLTEGHRARIEEKPEVRKAGGVYYTPQYIVDYIVKNTVGKLCEGRKPREVGQLRILDPACGSGSFLLGAYQYLLDWHLNWYRAEYKRTGNVPQIASVEKIHSGDVVEKIHEFSLQRGRRQGRPPKTKRKPLAQAIFQGMGGEWFLTTAEKKRILTNNIYGVDIDANAVEVTKLSLLLKVLEHETSETLNQQLGLWKERALPNLESNIKCGNSLIGMDFYEGRQTGFFNEEEALRINAFDWEREFAEIFANGGFDAVIGNPPYIRIQTMKEWAPLEVEIYKQRYTAASSGNYDIYVVFVERAFGFLKKQGRIGLILPHKFFQGQFGKPIRKFITQKKALVEIIHFGAEQVFQNATTYTCLLFLSPLPRDKFKFISVKKLKSPNEIFEAISKSSSHDDYEEAILTQPDFGGQEWNFSSGKKDFVLSKLRHQPVTLGDITRKIFVGLQTSADRVYVLKILEWRKDSILCYSNSLEQKVEIEQGLLKPFLMGKDVHRYKPLEVKNVVIFPYFVEDKKAILMDQNSIKKRYPKGWKYLLANKEILSTREKGKMRGSDFYAYIYPKNLAEFERKKIITPEIALGCQLTYDETGTLYHTTKVYSFIFNENQQEQPLYFLGILNSKLLWFFLKSTGYTLRGGYFTFKTEYLKPFPIRLIDFSVYKDKKGHDLIAKLVEKMLSLNKKFVTVKTAHEKTVLQRQIAATDRQIDQLVYQLYGLTEEEIEIVEQNL